MGRANEGDTLKAAEELLHSDGQPGQEVSRREDLERCPQNPVLGNIREEVGEFAGVSRVTARRYLDHLCQLRYGGPGRPEHRYRLVTSIPAAR